MNQRLRLNTQAEGGFTLIELIVVIVILGILAATALPKFASLGGDARYASLNAARGSLNTVVALTHGKYLLTQTTPVPLENVNVAMTFGYPSAATTTTDAAGLTVSGTGTDYVVYTSTPTSPATGPTLVSGEMAIIPASLVNKTAATTCYIKYAQAASSGAVPTVTMVGSATGCE